MSRLAECLFCVRVATKTYTIQRGSTIRVARLCDEHGEYIDLIIKRSATRTPAEPIVKTMDDLKPSRAILARRKARKDP